jgi:cytochrome c oxidase subunit 4
MSEAVPLKIYYRIFGALMVLTAVTVGIAFVDLGYLNTFVAVSIAVLKATLVLLFFMHVKYSNRLIWVFASAGFIWFIIMVAFTMSDYVGRTWVEAPIPLP